VRINKIFSWPPNERGRTIYHDVDANMELILRYFAALDQKRVCLYISLKKLAPRGKDAEFWPLDYHPFSLFNKCSKHPADFLIIFSMALADRNRIEQLLIICHEFQHAVQYTRDKKSYLYSCILRDYGTDGNGILVHRIPAEIDADITAKAVLENELGKKEVQLFIDELYSNKDSRFQVFGSYFANLNSGVNYDFKKETAKLWEEISMDKVLFKLKDSRTKRHRDIYKMYEFAVR